MTIGCNIWMICLILIWFFYGLSRMFQLPQFVWALRSSVWDVFINFLLIDATDKSKISSDQKRFWSHQTYTPFHFSRTLPLMLFFTYIVSKYNVVHTAYSQQTNTHEDYLVYFRQVTCQYPVIIHVLWRWMSTIWSRV